MEDYIPYRLAIKLKEKGYPMKEIQTWERDNRSIPVLYELSKDHPDWQYCKTWWIPTIYQVLKWLREEKKIHVEILIHQDLRWGYEAWDISEKLKPFGNVGYNSYAEYNSATLAGIEYALDNLI